MTKSLKFTLFLALFVFVISCSTEKAESEKEMNLEQQIGELQEKIQELAVKIESNPEAKDANELREMHQRYMNELEEIMAEAGGGSEKEELSAIERTKGAIQEYKVALEQNPDHKNVEEWKEALQELQQKLKRLEEGRQLDLTDREAKIKNIQEQIKELKGALNRNPDSEKSEEWQGTIREYEQELEQLMSSEQIDRPKSEEGEFPELELAIRRNEDQLKEMEMYLKDLEKKESETDKINEVKERIFKKRDELLELKSLLEGRKKGEYQPSAYQREKGEVTANVISATELNLTVQLEEGGRVMVFYIPSTRRVEGQRVPNTEVIELVKKLKKGQKIWAKYHEGEEKGTYILTEIKKMKEKN